MADREKITPYIRATVELEGLQSITKSRFSIPYLSKKIVILHLIGFLLGRASILEGLTPFGIAFFAALIVKESKGATVGLSTLIGIITIQGISGSVHYGVTLAIITGLFYFVLNGKKLSTIQVALISSGIYLGIGSLAFTFQDFYVYDLAMLSFETIVVFVVIYIASYALPVGLHRSNRKILSTEEIICVTIIAALALSGVNDIMIMSLSLKNILGILLTILFAYNGGAGVGAAVGVTLGLITSMSTGSTPVVIGVFAFSGLLAGIFKDLGKTGSALGFLMGNAILTFYINGYYEVLIQFREVMGAFILFILMPKEWIAQLEKFCNTKNGILNTSRSHSERMKKITNERLLDFSSTFAELSATFESIAEKQQIFAQEDLSKLMERAVNKVCGDCGMKRSCWEKNFNTTYQAMNDLLIQIETTEELDPKDLPSGLQKRCIYPKQILENMIHVYEINQVNMLWQNRLRESRDLVGEQMKGVSKIIGELAQELNGSIKFDVELEDAIYVALDQHGLAVKNIMVANDEGGNLEITVEKRPCYNRESCTQSFIPVISQVVGTKLVKQPKNCNLKNAQEGCRFTLVEARKFDASTKVARAKKEGNTLCGDSYTFMDLRNNQYMMAISDGMGTGDKAYIQSNATISMLEKMMEAGFEREIAINTINSMLMLKSTEEMFSTIDLALLDLYKGTVDFVKVGSAATFIKERGGKIKEINSSTLPIGILSGIQVEGNVKELKDDEFIIMVSDGILEIDEAGDGKWLRRFLANIDTRNPQELADKILYRAMEFTNNKALDDMTVMVTKVWKTK
ncbi:Sporulation stage II, protein E [Alkaliphilus metalliredigens QYMF]|uniref:Sporulation stage II, protein E n=1 Tax=Alkaliphilus metalliredigens (strain QYMF) TaxID=293826 RepID=A6TJP2_ALKMQ|nr:stage II sporulation protein E [Alkaliphilus metalliredigens]ABR46410.1 Sporulation stage II, protein E [Alkaliphilus metalliredigens QYMF]